MSACSSKHAGRPDHADAQRIAAAFEDSVILEADSRTMTGADIANHVTDKLTQVHDAI